MPDTVHAPDVGREWRAPWKCKGVHKVQVEVVMHRQGRFLEIGDEHREGKERTTLCVISYLLRIKHSAVQEAKTN